MKYSSLDTVLSSIQGLGDRFRQNKLDEESRKRGLLGDEQTNIAITKGKQDIALGEGEKRKIDEVNEKVRQLTSQSSVVTSPAKQQDAATNAEIANYDAIHAAPDSSSRRLLGGQVELAAKEKAAQPNYVEEYRASNEALAPYGELGKTYLGGKKDLADIQVKADKTTKGIFEELTPEAQRQIRLIAERRAKGIDPPDQYIKDFPAFGKNGSVRAVVDNLTYEINPNFNAYEGTIAYRAKRSGAEREATLSPKIIGKEAGKRYAETTAGEQAQRDIQKTNPMLSGEGAIKISQSAMAIKNLQRLKEELEKGNIDYFDIIKKTGQFKNPKVNNAYQQVSEIVGRQQSGAAIANHEWANFGKEILNRNFLLTEAGRKTALENIDDYLDRFHSVGILQTSDEDWYNKQNERVKAARSKAEPGKLPTSESVKGATKSPEQAMEAIKVRAKSGDSRAQQYLKTKGIQW